MKITLLYFAQLKEEIGLAEEVMEVDARITGKALLETLGAKYPVIKTLGPSLSLAVNEEYWGLEEPIPSDANIALIPPVSGG